MADFRRPFWRPASNYYVLSIAICGVFFFVIWGVMMDLGDTAPWVTAGVGASIILIGSVLLRAILIRKLRVREDLDRRLRAERRALSGRITSGEHRTKITIEENQLLLGEIKQRSDAARLLGRISASHREVWEICSEYLAMNERELKNISPSSPRLAPLLKGRSMVTEYHRSHILRWAEIEATNLTAQANTRSKMSERIEAAEAALGVVDTALTHYPQDASLLESRDVLLELIGSIKVARLVERGERAAQKGDIARARTLYEEAISRLGSENSGGSPRFDAIEHLKRELAALERRSERAEDLSTDDED